jgi:hypothetical protein
LEADGGAPFLAWPDWLEEALSPEVLPSRRPASFFKKLSGIKYGIRKIKCGRPVQAPAYSTEYEE